MNIKTPVADRVRSEVIRLCGAGCRRKRVAFHVGASQSTIDIIVWKAQAEGLLPKGLRSDPDMRIEDVTCDQKPDEIEEAVWSYARKLAAARRIKARHCISHIADDLNGLPGPKVSPRDVLVLAGRL